MSHASECDVKKHVSREVCSRIMDGLRRFIMVHNHEAVKVGVSEKDMAVKPKFTTDFPEAVVREVADELTLRAEEEGALRTFTDTTDVGDSRWEPPLVDEDWHAICQATYKGVEEIGMGEHVLRKYVETHKAVNLKKPKINKKARALWALRNAKKREKAAVTHVVSVMMRVEPQFGKHCGKHT